MWDILKNGILIFLSFLLIRVWFLGLARLWERFRDRH